MISQYKSHLPHGMQNIGILIYVMQVIDDSIFENSEEFELRLTDSSYNAKIGLLSSATVIIDGPNDGKLVLPVWQSFGFH